MSTENEPAGYVSRGVDSQHEDFLVGDEQGLRELIAACEIALRDGELERDVGDFIGVRKLERTWFEEQAPDASDTTKTAFCALLILAAVLVGLGVYQLLEWTVL